MTTRSPASPCVLIVGVFDAVDRCLHALREVGATVLHIVNVAELERWPLGHVVVCAAPHATAWWKDVGATHLIVVDADASAHPHADHVLRPPVTPSQLVSTVLGCVPPEPARPAVPPPRPPGER